MSKGLENLIHDLQGNVTVVSKFNADIDKVVQEYELSNKEKELLRTKDVEGLIKLGLQETEAVGALSNAHSSTCGPRTTRA